MMLLYWRSFEMYYTSCGFATFLMASFIRTRLYVNRHHAPKTVSHDQSTCIFIYYYSFVLFLTRKRNAIPVSSRQSLSSSSDEFFTGLKCHPAVLLCTRVYYTTLEVENHNENPTYLWTGPKRNA